MSRIFGPHDPPQPKPPATVPVDVTVTPSAALPCTVSLESSGVILTKTTNQDGWCRFDVPREWRNTQITVVTGNPDYESAGNPILLDGQPHMAPSQFWVTLAEVVVIDPPPQPIISTPRLHRDGHWLIDPAGVRQCLPGLVGFPLYALWLRGRRDDVRTYLAYCREHRIRLTRVLGSYNGSLGRFIPTDFGDAYYTEFRPFLDEAASLGVYVKFDVWADKQTPELAGLSTDGVYRRLEQAAQGATNLQLGGGNEWQKNGWLPSDLTHPTTVWASKGSGIGEAFPPQPSWDSADFHPDRGGGLLGDPWASDVAIENSFVRKVQSVSALYRGDTGGLGSLDGACAIDEPIGIDELPAMGKSTNSPLDWWTFCAGAKIFGASYVVAHTRATIVEATFALPGPQATACVDAGVHALETVPNEFAFATYENGQRDDNSPNLPVHHIDRFTSDTPDGPRYERPKGTVRTYGQVDHAAGRGVTIDMQPGRHWPGIQPRAPWVIEETWGWAGHQLVARVRR